MANRFSHQSAIIAAVANQLVTTTNMKVGAYTVANSGAMPTTPGARLVTVTHTQVGGVTDTLGTIIVVGTDINGAAATDTITPIDGTVATGVVFFSTVTSVTGAGWVINTGNDTLVVGVSIRTILASGSGTLASVSVNTTAAGAITVKDASGTILVLKASIGEGNYRYDVGFSGFLEVILAAASDATFIYKLS